MTISLEDIAQLHADGLTSNLQSLLSLVLSSNEFNQSPHLASLDEQNTIYKKYHVMVYYGDSLFVEESYKSAEKYFSEALKLKKNLAKMKSKATTPSTTKSVGNSTTQVTEVEIKYKIYQCNLKMENFKECLSTLESIIPKQRTPKINMALGRLYKKHGMERSALTCYKEVLRSSPLALDAAECLLKLGVSLQEVTSLMTTSKSKIPEWLLQYVKATSFAAVYKYQKAIQVFKSIDNQHVQESTALLSKLGEWHYRIDEKQHALNYLSKAHILDKTSLKGMDIYAHILAEKSKITELEKLAQELSEVTQTKTEPWVAMSYYCSCTNQKARAIYFAQKAHTTDTTNVEALTLKASLLQSLNKHQEAIIHFREAVRLAPNNVEAYEGLVESHIAMNRTKEAMNIARNARKTIGSNARIFTLCAKVYSKDPNLQEKAKTMLKNALAHGVCYLPAIYQLGDLFIKEENFEAAAEILQKQLERQQTATLYQMYGDCLREMGETSKSMEQYNKALRLDPENIKAIDGKQYLESDANSELDMSSIQELRNRDSMEGLETLGSDQESPWMD